MTINYSRIGMESVDFLLESESDFWIFLESESEPESGCTRNRASLTIMARYNGH